MVSAGGEPSVYCPVSEAFTLCSASLFLHVSLAQIPRSPLSLLHLNKSRPKTRASSRLSRSIPKGTQSAVGLMYARETRALGRIVLSPSVSLFPASTLSAPDECEKPFFPESCGHNAGRRENLLRSPTILSLACRLPFRCCAYSALLFFPVDAALRGQRETERRDISFLQGVLDACGGGSLIVFSLSRTISMREK